MRNRAIKKPKGLKPRTPRTARIEKANPRHVRHPWLENPKPIRLADAPRPQCFFPAKYPPSERDDESLETIGGGVGVAEDSTEAGRSPGRDMVGWDCRARR